MGAAHGNESRWAVLDGCLAFLNRAGTPTTIFTTCERVNGALTLKGKFVLNPGLEIVHKLSEISIAFEDRPRIHSLTRVYLAGDIEKYGWVIGDHTYGRPSVIEKIHSKLRIGKFCSIAGGVMIILGNHRIDGVTSYPFSALKRFWPSMQPLETNDHSGKGGVDIGNDVWLGYGVTIMPGVKIGDGAVVAAESVVTKDVLPYSVVGGNPARVLKHRHSSEDVKSLMHIRWWDWDDRTLNDRLPLMMTDMAGFIKKYGA